jgi:hypothetical protein
MNRVTKYAEMVATRVETLGDKTLDGTSWEDADESLAINLEDRVAYQNAQSRAYAEGKLTYDESWTVYSAVGASGSSSNGGWSESTTYPMKVAVTTLIHELMAP